MTTKEKLFGLMLGTLLGSCDSAESNKKFEHNYTKYWEKYSKQELVDNLYSDTLIFGKEIGGDRTDRDFYIYTTKELITDLEDDREIVDSLFPNATFDQVTIKKLPLGFKTILTREQIEDILQIINDPTSFSWAETTFEPAYQIDFLNENKIITSFTTDLENAIIKPNIEWPNFKKMKFGALKDGACKKLRIVLQNTTQSTIE